MKKLSRREFLGKSALGLGSAMLVSQLPLDLKAAPSGSLNMPIGFQTWTIRGPLTKDFPGTLKMMADIGYQSLEMCSPKGYMFAGFGALAEMSAKEMKQIINDAGLVCESSHYVFNELKQNLDERIEFALELGQKQMILSSFGLSQKATLDDWRKAADELNEIGMKSKSRGMQMGYHNHNGEFEKIDDKLIYDVLLEQFEPDFIKMQFQVAVISIGYKAADYFRNYPGRFISAHLADFDEDKKTQVPVGKGIVDWKEFFATLDTGGVKNIFVEMDPDAFEESAKFLKSV
jgi:sugar phosphate isomerase/epimerase